MKIAKFLVASNQLVDKSVYIIHTREPRFIAAPIPGKKQFEIIQQIDDLNTLQDDKREALIKRAEAWYFGIYLPAMQQ